MNTPDRHFRFTLRLRDGRIVTEQVVAPAWRWSDAYSEACSKVEARFGLPAYSGIVCVAYDSTHVDSVATLLPPRELRPVA